MQSTEKLSDIFLQTFAASDTGIFSIWWRKWGTQKNVNAKMNILNNFALYCPFTYATVGHRNCLFIDT